MNILSIYQTWLQPVAGTSGASELCDTGQQNVSYLEAYKSLLMIDSGCISQIKIN